MELEWRDIPGFEGFYKVSNKGDVLALPRLICVSKKKTYSYIKSGRTMIAVPLSNGYLIATLWNNGAQSNWLIHRLVALAFLENPNGYEQVNHLNGNKKDNRVENLEWCTRSHNMRHAFSIGLIKKRRHKAA